MAVIDECVWNWHGDPGCIRGQAGVYVKRLLFNGIADEELCSPIQHEHITRRKFKDLMMNSDGPHRIGEIGSAEKDMRAYIMGSKTISKLDAIFQVYTIL